MIITNKQHCNSRGIIDHFQLQEQLMLSTMTTMVMRTRVMMMRVIAMIVRGKPPTS